MYRLSLAADARKREKYLVNQPQFKGSIEPLRQLKQPVRVVLNLPHFLQFLPNLIQRNRALSYLNSSSSIELI